MPRRTTKGFNAQAFHKALADVVEARSVSWGQVSAQTGVTRSTLSRIGQGGWPDGAGLAALSAWANLNPADFVEPPFRKGTTSAPLTESLALLHADPHLTSEYANVLKEIINAAYAIFTEKMIRTTRKRAKLLKPASGGS